VFAGNVDGAGRLEFSVIGDAVNVAARVEATTRETGETERTRELLRDPPALREHRTVALKGKREPVSLYAPDH
jgi:adenylate cyclase